MFDNVLNPLTFNDDECVVAPCNIDIPDTFNDDANVVLFDNVVNPLTFNVPLIIALLDNVVNPDTFNDDAIVVLFDNVTKPETVNDDEKLTVFPTVKPWFILTFPELSILIRSVVGAIPVWNTTFNPDKVAPTPDWFHTHAYPLEPGFEGGLFLRYKTPLFIVASPETFNAFWHVVIPLTFNEDAIVVLFDNVVFPETFNDDANVVLFDNVAKPDTFNDEFNVTIL